MSRYLHPQLVSDCEHIMKSFFVFLLLIISCSSLESKNLIEFENYFKELDSHVEYTILSIKDALQNVTSDSSIFLNQIENSSIANLNFFNGRRRVICGNIPDLELSNIKEAFKVEVSRLEGPLLRTITELEEKISSFRAVLGSIAKTADTKYWGCKLSGEDCETSVEVWLNQTLEILTCKVIDCATHTLRKRQLNVFQFENEEDVTTSQTTPIEDCQGYLCSNFRCVHYSMICDEIDDCGDNSDERNCNSKKLYTSGNCSLELGTYLCDNKECVDLAKVCNGRDDCGDGSDEGGDCAMDCLEICGPRGVCFRSPRGGDCLNKCPPGTFETVSGCESILKPGSSSITRQVEEVPKFLSRHSSAYLFLKTSLIARIEKTIADISKSCFYERFFPLLNFTSPKNFSSNNLHSPNTGL